MAEVKLVVKQVDEGSQGIKTMGQSLTDMVGVAKNVTVGLVAMGATFKKAFDLSKEGANLNQLRDSFEYMNQEVFKTPGLLDDMSAAVRGTIKETDLMAGLLTLTAGTTGEVSKAMAAAAPQLLEIAKASNKLNPALGDTTFLFESISKGVKRQSPLILDNLGLNIKMEAAYRTLADSLGVSVDSLDANQRTMAVLNATLAAGDILIEQVGGNVDSQADSWARLEVKVAEGTDAFKSFLADGLLPVVSMMSGDYNTAVETTIENNIEMAKSFDDLVKSAQGVDDAKNVLGGFGGVVTGTSDEINAGLDEMAQKLATSATSYGQFEGAIRDWSVKSQNHFDLFLSAQGLTIEQFYAQAQAEKRAAGEADQLNEQMARMVQYNRDAAAAAEANSEETLAAAAAYEAAVAEGESYDRVLLQNYGHMQEAANAAREYGQALAEQLGNLGSTGDAIDYLMDAQQALADGQEGAAEQVAMANEDLIASYRELAFEGSLALAELSPDPEAVQRVLDYAVAIGQLTQEEADLRLAAAEARLGIEELNQIVVDGDVDARIAAEAFRLLAEGEAKTAAEAIHAAEVLLGLSDIMNNLPTEHSFVIKITQDGEVPVIPTGPQGKNQNALRALGGPVSGGEYYQVGEGNQPELFNQGGKLYLIPGDNGQVFSNSQSQGMMGGVNINGPLIGQVVQRPGENGRAFADRVSTMVVDRIGSLK